MGPLMTMMVGLIGFTLSGTALSQGSLGELQDKGAVRVTRDAFMSLLPVTIAGIDPAGSVNFKLEFKENGKFSGHSAVIGDAGTNSSSFGNWTVDDNGKQCIHGILSRWNMRLDECYYLYRLDEGYFSVQIDSDPKTKALNWTVLSDK